MAAGDHTTFPPGEIDRLVESIEVNGFGIVRGAIDEMTVADLEQELADAQQRLVDGALGPRHGTVILDEPGAAIGGRPFAHYVTFATEASSLAAAAVRLPALVDVARSVLGPGAWLLDYEQFGVVYQDARPGPGSGYSRIGWATHHQSGPPITSPGPPRRSCRGSPSPSTSIPPRRPTDSSGFLRAAVTVARPESPWGSRESQGRSPSTPSAGTSSFIIPISGMPRHGQQPTVKKLSAGTFGVVGTAAAGWRSDTEPTIL